MSHATVLDRRQSIDGREPHLGHWQPAFRPNDQEPTLVLPSLLDQSKSSETTSSRRDLSEPPRSIPSTTTRLEGQPLLDDARSQRRTSLSHMRDASSQGEAPQSSNTHVSTESNGHDERHSSPTRAFSEQTSLQDADEPRVAISKLTEITVPEAKEPAYFGLSLPSRRSQAHNDGSSELSSDDDKERLDPAWGIKRMDPSQVLAQVQRSPSFPDFVSRSEHATAEPPAHLPMTQAEMTLEEVEEITGGHSPFTREPSLHPTRLVQSGEEHEHALDEPLDEPGHAIPADEPMNHEISEETRFEEGVPLMLEESDQPEKGNPVVTGPSADNLFDISEETEEASFFGTHAEDTAEAHQPPSLNRKDTTDVLQALHFSSNEISDFREDKLSHHFPEDAQDTDWLGPSEGYGKGKKEEKDEDISEMWKAALEDDEFLVEDPDELLPDSAPDSPSSFLESLQADDSNVQEPRDANLPSDIQRSREAAHVPGDQRHEKKAYQSSNPYYAPHQPSTSDLTQMSSSSFGKVSFSRPGIPSMNSTHEKFQRPAPPPKAESFVDQSKGGYKSPYDLPLDISKPRKRPQMQASAAISPTFPPPPPRSSSMTSEKSSIIGSAQLQSTFSPTNASFPFNNRSSSSNATPGLPAKAPPTAATQTPLASPASVSFFEELPSTSRARPPNAQGRYTPQQSGSMAPPPLLPQSPSSSIHPTPSQSSSLSHAPSDPYSQYRLQQPERLDPYANLPLQPPPAPIGVANRYSPAPASSQTGARPMPSPRYSPAPPPQPITTPPLNRYASQPMLTTQPPQGQPSPNRYASQPVAAASSAMAAHAFQPRTSSPLAYSRRSIDTQATEAFPAHVNHMEPSASTHIRNPERYYSESQSQTYPQQFPSPAVVPPLGGAAVLDPAFQPPVRSQTQSPGKRGLVSQLAMTNPDAVQRPASVHGQMSPTKPSNPYDFALPRRASVRRRGLSQIVSFIPPTGEERNDELQRWKGSPIFRFGFGGWTVSSFPRHVPRYGAGSSQPMMKPSAGEIHINSVKDISSQQNQATKFPGPLRSKSKKKEVLAWLSTKIASFEGDEIHFTSRTQLPDPRKCNDEKILLWKIVKTMVEHDGILEGPAGVQKDINIILSPEAHLLDDASAIQYTSGSDFSGMYKPTGTTAKPEAVDPIAVETLRRHLLRGEREKAMWHAVDNRLWAHALLIASTLDTTKWKEVVQEFVRREVKVIGTNTESLAALYEVFAGNLDESIDELVPPSARAGLQLVSKVDSVGPSRNALDGLDRWRETLSLILNNRSSDDYQALAALGGLLVNYGRVEASHICYLFSRNPGRLPIFTGVDDPSATIVLLGADHRAHPSSFFQDEDAILLTEVYEFATSVLSTSSQSASMPHLQAYKLQRAFILAETGYKNDSQAYCDAISAISKSTTKASPYYGPQFFEVLEELSRRLKQTPTDSSSWIAKPSMEKVSGSVWNKFHSFVAGDESDAESKASGKELNFDAGPFANVTGTPSLSRSGSTSDMYGTSLANAPQAMSNTIAGSRYAPMSQQVARSSPELLRTRNSLDYQRSPPFSNPIQSNLGNDQSSSFGSQNYMHMAANSYQVSSQSPPSSRYQSTPPQTSYAHAGSVESSPQRLYRSQQHETYVPTPPPEDSIPNYMPASHQYPQESEGENNPYIMPAFNGHSPLSRPELQQAPVSLAEEDSRTQMPTQSYSYEPPLDTGYVPYEPDPESDSENRRDAPRKKSFMDDNDDDFQRVPTGVSSKSSPPNAADDAAARRRANDLATEAAFLAAAAEDAKKDKDKDSKTDKSKTSGWFSGWLPGKKDDSLDAGSTGGKEGEKKAIKAKLGEESAFYYDKELKRWVNKKDPNSMQAGVKAAPPPPKGPTGIVRGAPPSASLPNLNGPPDRTRTPDDNGPMPRPAMNGPSRTDAMGPPAIGRPPSGAGTPPNGLGSTSLVPPPRPSTANSTSSIDDLLGPPSAAGRKSVRGAKGKAKGRYVDLVAAKQADT